MKTRNQLLDDLENQKIKEVFREGWHHHPLLPTSFEKSAGAPDPRRTEFGEATVWLPCRPPRYWGRYHRKRATEVARDIGVCPRKAGKAIQVLFDIGLRTDEEDVWGPSIATFLATYKQGGNDALDWIMEWCPPMAITAYDHLGEHFFWSRKSECSAKFIGGLSRRRWSKWRLICRLLRKGVRGDVLPFSVIDGIDRLYGRSKVIAFAVLSKIAREDGAEYDAEYVWQEIAKYLRGEDRQQLIPYMSRGDVWHVFHGRFPFVSSKMNSLRTQAQYEKILIAELAKNKRLRYFQRFVSTEDGDHTLRAGARLAIWLEERAEAFVKRSGLSLHDAGINLPAYGATEEKAQFLFRHAHKAYTASSIIKSWDTILEQLGWEESSGEPNPLLLGKGSLEKAEQVISTFAYDGTRHLEFARVAAECHVNKQEFSYIQDQWLDALEKLTHQSVPAPYPYEDGELRLKQLPKEDPRAVFAGIYTGCCQHPTGIGSTCAAHAHAEPNGAIWAVEHYGRIVAQAWVWRHEDVLVLDSIEMTASIGKDTENRTKNLFKKGAESVLSKLCVKSVFGGAHVEGIETGAPMQRPFRAPAGCYTDSRSIALIAGELWRK